VAYCERLERRLAGSRNSVACPCRRLTGSAEERFSERRFRAGRGYDTTPQVTYWYDGQTPTGCSPTLTSAFATGRRSGMCDGAGWEAWSYDVRGRILTERRSTNAVIKTTSYTYNLDGSLATATYPSGRTITYTVNAAGRAVSAVDVANSINYATNAAYGAFGALGSVQNGASVYATFLYNTRLQPCWLYVTTTSGGAPSGCTQTGVATGAVQDFQYDFGLGVADNGNVNGLINNRNSARTQTFTFDELNRLKTALTQGTSGSQCFGLDYAYDIWGNLTATTLDAARPSCSWTTPSVGVSTNNQITNTGFSYDAAGNELSDGSLTYSWDAESQMKTAAGVTYTYNGDGRRVQKSNGTVYWYGATGDILDETDAAGNLTNEYVYFAGKRMARRDSGNNVYYYFEDHLGSSRVITQGNGTVCYDADYDPFGKEVVVTNTCPQNYKFNGKERDAESNLDDFGARYYSSQFGRWTSADWSGGPSTVPYAELVNPQSLNLYAYARNNPVTSADLDGHVVAQDTANKMANDLGGQGSWSPRGEEQETGRELDTTDYSCGRLSMVTFGYVDPDTDETIVTSEEVMFSSQVSQAQNQNQTKQLTADDVSKAIKTYDSDKEDKNPGRVVKALDAMGKDFTVTGDTLRTGVKYSGVTLPKDADKVLANVNSITRTGDKVVITNKGSMTIDLFGQIGKTISFTINESVKGKSGYQGPALQNLKGVGIGVSLLAYHPDHWGPE